MQVSDPTLTKLLLCLRPDSDLNLMSDLDQETWTGILKLAHHYSVVPLLYRRLIRENPGLALPPAIYQEIRRTYYATLAENAQCYNTLAEALAALHSEGIPVILLKGAHLAEQIYGDIGLRPMSDLDLLVPHRNLPQALDSLRKACFAPVREYFEEADGTLHFHAPAMIKDGTTLEIHWDLSRPDGPWKADIDGIWQRAVLLKFQAGQSLTLSRLDILLYLCVHASYNHVFIQQLRSIYDIREMLINLGNGFNWHAFSIAVESWNVRKGVYLALRLAKELAAAEVPPEVLAALEPPGFDLTILDWAKVQLLRQTPALSTNFTRVMRKGSLFQRLRALWIGLFPPPIIMSMVYGVPSRSWRLALLYPSNAITRLYRYAGHALDLIQNNPGRTQEADGSLNLIDWLGVKG